MQTEVPAVLLLKAYAAVERTSGSLPFDCRGIQITKELVKTVMELLNAEGNKTLPQHCANDIVERTQDGLDRRIKEQMGSDLRTANIVSDVMAKAGIVQVVRGINPATGREVKGTRLRKGWRW